VKQRISASETPSWPRRAARTALSAGSKKRVGGAVRYHLPKIRWQTQAGAQKIEIFLADGKDGAGR
jgi:hypothetical protein